MGKTTTTPVSNTAVHKTHRLITEKDLQENPTFARKHPYLSKDILYRGFLVCKNCGRQNVENLGNYCQQYRPQTRPTRIAMAVKQVIGSLPTPSEVRTAHSLD